MANEPEVESEPSDIKSIVMRHKGLIIICTVGVIMLGGAIGLAFLNYYDKPLPESISQVLVPSPVTEVGNDIPTIFIGGEEVTVDGPSIVLYDNHNISCTVLAGVITDEVARGAAKRGCDYQEMPFIDEIRLCNSVTKTCNLLNEVDL